MPWPLEKSEFLMSVLTWINLPKYFTLTVYLTAFMIFSIKKKFWNHSPTFPHDPIKMLTKVPESGTIVSATRQATTEHWGTWQGMQTNQHVTRKPCQFKWSHFYVYSLNSQNTLSSSLKKLNHTLGKRFDGGETTEWPLPSLEDSTDSPEQKENIIKDIVDLVLSRRIPRSLKTQSHKAKAAYAAF